MPRQNGTGPTGKGSGTGRGMGSCGTDSGLGVGRGYGRVTCGRFWRKYQVMPDSEKKEVLRGEIEDLKQELAMVEDELRELEK